MQSQATTVEEYCRQVPIVQADAFSKLRMTIKHHIPAWFEECMNYGMIGYVVPHSLYPAWYHCDTKLPVPFIWLAYQKNSINLYHMWIYADPELLQRFTTAFAQLAKRKIDMWKSCIRFKYYDDIPYDLIWQLVSRMDRKTWISLYENTLKK